MTGGDWHDPFADDPEAIERERRRAEREARRRQRQGSLGEKVAEQQRAGEAPEAPADRPPPSEPAAQPADRPAPRDSAPQPAAPPPPAPATDEAAPRASSPPTAERATHADPAIAPPRPPTGERPTVRPSETEEQPAPPLRGRTRAGAGGVPPNKLRIRRLVAAALVIGLAALVVFGLVRLIDAVGGSDDPAPSQRQAKVSELTIPEGLDRRQIADVAKEAGLKGDYLEASKSFQGFDPTKYGAEGSANLEGFLFPALYELPRKATVKDLIGRQLAALQANLKEVDFSYAKSKNLTKYDVLTIASMVEREIQVPEERKLAAAVIYNRLAANNPLGIDATIRYEDQNYDEPLTESRLAEDTAYNTRTRPGLPPTPIANPGLASIEAAANPAKSDAFYFVVKPGTCGEHVFVETEREFNEAEAAYQQALEEEGGSPTEC